MSEWKEVGVGTAWDFKKEGKGAEFQGVYLSKDEHIGENDSNVYNFRMADDSVMSVWGSTILDARFKNLQVGEEVKVVYLGTEPSQKRKGKSFHNFNVWHRTPEFVKTEPSEEEVRDDEVVGQDEVEV